MNLLNYITNLLPNFSRDKLIESCNLTRQGIEDNTLPCYQAAAELFKGKSFKSKEVNDFSKVYSKKAEKVSGVGMLSSIAGVLENASELLEFIADRAKDDFSNTEVSAALTYKKATIVKTVQLAEFVSTYSRKFLNYIYILEITNKDNTVDLKDSIVPAQKEWLETNFYNFADSCKVLLTSRKNFIKALDVIPDSAITRATEEVLPTTAGLSKIDPLNLRGISVTYSPFYLLGMVVASYQANKYKASKAELELLQVRLFQMEQTLKGTNDAALEKQVSYMQSRVDDLSFEVAKMEKDYGING